jgi:hypothetical protein
MFYQCSVAVPGPLRGENEVEEMTFEAEGDDGELVQVICEDWNSESREKGH